MEIVPKSRLNQLLWGIDQWRIPKRLKDDLLDLDVQAEDSFYRMLQQQRIVYLLVKPPELIPADARHHGWSLVRWLSRLDEWRSTDWTTLTIEDVNGLRCTKDTFCPHSISSSLLQPQLQRINILDLAVISTKSDRVRHVMLPGGTTAYLKYACLDFEVEATENEIKIYHALEHMASELVPQLLGYVHDGVPDRVIGFLLEDIPGRSAHIEDQVICAQAIKSLHAIGVLHGDLRRYNLIVRSTGEVAIIDFECSKIKPAGDNNDQLVIDWLQRANREFESLEEVLRDDSGIGRPWDEDWI